MIILFETNEEAEEMAFILKGRWDNYNAIELESFDPVAFDLALKLCKVENWCFEKDSMQRIQITKSSGIKPRSSLNYSDVLGVKKVVFY